MEFQNSFSKKIMILAQFFDENNIKIPIKNIGYSIDKILVELNLNNLEIIFISRKSQQNIYLALKSIQQIHQQKNIQYVLAICKRNIIKMQKVIFNICAKFLIKNQFKDQTVERLKNQFLKGKFDENLIICQLYSLKKTRQRDKKTHYQQQIKDSIQICKKELDEIQSRSNTLKKYGIKIQKILENCQKKNIQSSQIELGQRGTTKMQVIVSSTTTDQINLKQDQKNLYYKKLTKQKRQKQLDVCNINQRAFYLNERYFVRLKQQQGNKQEFKPSQIDIKYQDYLFMEIGQVIKYQKLSLLPSIDKLKLSKKITQNLAGIFKKEIIHGDFKIQNMVKIGQNIFLIDFENSTTLSLYKDLPQQQKTEYLKKMKRTTYYLYPQKNTLDKFPEQKVHHLFDMKGLGIIITKLFLPAIKKTIEQQIKQQISQDQIFQKLIIENKSQIESTIIPFIFGMHLRCTQERGQHRPTPFQILAILSEIKNLIQSFFNYYTSWY